MHSGTFSRDRLAAVHRHYTVINLILFKLGWVLLVGLQDRALSFVVLLVIVMIVLNPAPLHALLTSLVVALPGIMADSLLSRGGLFDFRGDLIPWWLCLLWLTFGLALPHGLAFLKRWPMGIQMLAGALASLSYLAGWRLGAVDFPHPAWLTGTLVAVLWALMLPLFIRLQGGMAGRDPATGAQQ